MSAKQDLLNPELVRWLTERQSALHIVKTTRTPSGMVLDWVPIESQAPGGKTATPPPAPEARVDESLRRIRPVVFELDDPSVERGPSGTVPIVRPDLSRLDRTVALTDYLTKRGGLRVNRGRSSEAPADPTPAGYFHNTSGQSGTFYGWDGYFNVWDPTINVPAGGRGEDHSILQVWLQNSSDKALQSLEGGWTVDRHLNGDTLPHVFTYYTTNTYTKDGDYIGGYNALHKGWVQYSGPSTTGRTVHPGIAITSISAFDGPQYDLQMKFQLYADPGTGELNWWVSAEDVWMGYYPASLFDPATLGSVVNWIASGGEVYSGLKNPEATADQMGSGSQALAGAGKAAYLRNLRNQSSMDGTMVDHNGSALSDVATPGGADPYTIQMFMKSGGSWGSYLYAGGQTPPTNILASWPTHDGPLPEGVWDGKNWSEAQHARASNDRFLDPPGGEYGAIRFLVTGTPENVDEISFNVAIDRPGGDPTCWTGLGNDSVVELGPVLQHLGLSVAQANGRGFYISDVHGAHQPFEVIAVMAD
ncbi:neprosin family prolyl endopeptidase [Paraburkholderia sp. HP33-1]|uniref:neprosin family prolyl endopeptidase n=1 Tax=Paraburkholderia sp. HP33-1 TaxID=2883243 RepID=UPI001F3ED259|nr:neprosin family prolyl endopeptidase [Paraburkholderia sp. HP33-1]